MKLDFLRWLRESAAGFFVSGSSGTGKSQLMRLIMHQLASTGEGFFLLDPHGDLAQDVERDLSTLPPRVWDQVIIVRPSDTANLVGLNPLSVPFEENPIRRKARLVTKVMHTAMILLSAWGESDFNSKPVMFKWTFRFLLLLALAGLPISAIRFFFDASHPVYRALLDFAPDFIARMELEELAKLKPKDREDIIASTKNRFLGWLSNPIVSLTLSQTEGLLDVRQLIQQRKIVLISLEAGEGELHDTDVEILANLWLAEISFAIFTTPPDRRVPTTVLIDELPTYFQSSFPLLARMMPTTRKTMCRWVTAAQGAYTFPDAADSPLLNLLIGQCGVHFLFGHRNFRDCEYFGKVAQFSSVDLHRRKHTVHQPVQLNVGHDVVRLYDEGINWSDAKQRGESTAEAMGQTETSTDQTTQTATHGVQTHPDAERLREVVTETRADMQGHSTAAGRTTTNTQTQNWSATRTDGGSRTRRQTLVPRLKTIVLEQITFMTAEEQFLEVASKMAGFEVGECIIHRGGVGSWIVKLPLLKNRYHRTPRFAQKRLLQLRERLYGKPIYRPATEVLSWREQFTTKLVEHLQRRLRGEYSSQRLPNTNEKTAPAIDPVEESHVPWSI